MKNYERQGTSWVALTSIALAVAAPVAVAAPPAASLEGLVIAVDGRAAAGFGVHLIDEDGRAVARAAADEGGRFTFAELPPGSYALGIETPEGRLAPVAAPAVRLAAGERARRDVKLVAAPVAGAPAWTGRNHGLGLWWAALSTASKAWVVVGGVAIVGITVAALGDDDDDDASPH
jgi:hypothetical protein